MQLDLSKPEKRIQRTALRITRWIGSPTSLIFHTIVFIACFSVAWLGYVQYDHMLLVLTTIVSLEAIYLSIFIQLTVNMANEAVEDISEDVEEIQEDIDELQENVEDISEDVEEISEDVGEISEEVEEMTEEEIKEEEEEEMRKEEQKKTLIDIQSDLRKLVTDIERLKNNPPNV